MQKYNGQEQTYIIVYVYWWLYRKANVVPLENLSATSVFIHVKDGFLRRFDVNLVFMLRSSGDWGWTYLLSSMILITYVFAGEKAGGTSESLQSNSTEVVLLSIPYRDGVTHN